MPDYQIEARSARSIRIGRDGETVASFRQGRFVQDMKGRVGRDPCTMKLPAPWRGMRYRLAQAGRELAHAGRPDFERRIVRFDLEMPGRKLELVGQDPHGLVFLLLEGGIEVGRLVQREFDEDDEWTADFHTREESPALAAFVAWLVREGRGMLLS